MNMKKIILVGICFCTAQLFAVNRHTIYVSPNGNDNAVGSLSKPLRTVEEALRQAKEIDVNVPVDIVLRAGVYEQAKTLEVNRSNLAIYPYGIDKVIISGGKKLLPSNLKKVKDSDVLERLQPQVRKYIKEIDFASLNEKLIGLHAVGFGRPSISAWTEVFIDGKPLNLSRWPNDSTVLIGKIKESGIAKNGEKVSFPIFSYLEDRPSSWKNSDELWIGGYFAHGYADDMIKVERIDTISKMIYTAQHTLYGFMTGAPFRRWFALNLLEELDMPGEYVVDEKRQKIYVYLAKDRVEDVQFSFLDTPIMAIENCNNVKIKGITFEYGRQIGIYMENTNQVIVSECTIRNMGGTGICIGRGSLLEGNVEGNKKGGEPLSRQIGDLMGKIYDDPLFDRKAGTENGIVNCLIYNVGAGGINMGGGNRTTLEHGNNYVENCRIHSFNRIEKSYRPGIWLDGVGNRISKCDIYDAPSMAILFHGNDNIIELCNISRVCNEIDDQGAVYYGRDPSELGNVIRYCYFHDFSTRHRVSATYHDDGACGAEVYGNIYCRAGSVPVLIGGGHYNHYKNNIFMECPVAIHIDARMQKWGKFMIEKGGVIDSRLNRVNYTQPPYSEVYPNLVSYWDMDPSYPQHNIIEGNLFYNINNVVRGETQWLELKNNWSTSLNPGWVDVTDPLKGFRPDALVYKNIQGFEKIPFDKIGCDLPYEISEENRMVRIMSYNVHNAIGMDGKTDCNRIADIITSVNPDVVAIQEVDSMTIRSKRKDILGEIAKQTGMKATFAEAIPYQGGKYGIGILSKEKPIRVKRVPLPGREEARTMMLAEFNDYVFVATHFSLTKADQELSIPLILNELRPYNKPIFFAGDMNSVPNSKVQKDLRKYFNVLTAGDWLTCNGTCIDFIYEYKENAKMSPVLHKEMIKDYIASDHCPIYVDVMLAK